MHANENVNLKKKERNSNHELLRILATLMILGLHYLNGEMGGALNPDNTSKINLVLARILESICIVGVNIFVLITGYYSYKTNKIKVNKGIELYLIMTFYALVFLIFSDNITLKNLICSIAPFLVGRRWFVETYLILLIFIPFLNRIIADCTKKSLKLLIMAQIIIFSCWSTFLPSAPILDNGYGITNFILLYFIGAYISKFGFKMIKKKVWIILYAMCILFMTLNNCWWSYCSIFCIIGAVSLFMIFTECRDFSSALINKVSKYCFAVFLIHSDTNSVGLWYRKVLHTQLFWKSDLFILHFFIGIIILFICCVLIDMGRKIIFRYTIDKILKKNRYGEIIIM